ncbi:hypothetical protein [Rhodococcus sp. NPDC058521]|uniref:hypothetical protein n=1 Tax=Rhodococcus sp. NPDC058521 TaxID=3346536 RepID=UPI003650FB94
MSNEVSGVDSLMSLAAQAKAGELVLDADVAVDCANACKEAIASLEESKSRMEGHTGLLPLGNFDCGDDLAVILSDTTKQYIARLDEHITCLRAIHDMVGAQVAESLTTDEETAAALSRMNA